VYLGGFIITHVVARTYDKDDTKFGGSGVLKQSSFSILTITMKIRNRFHTTYSESDQRNNMWIIVSVPLLMVFLAYKGARNLW